MTAVPVRAMTAQERSVPPSGSESVGVRVRHVKLNTRILVHPGPGPPTLHRPRPSELDAAAAAARPACTQHQRRPNRAASPSCRLPWPRKRPGMHCPACARQPNRAASRRKRPKGGAGDGRGPGSPPPRSHLVAPKSAIRVRPSRPWTADRTSPSDPSHPSRFTPAAADLAAGAWARAYGGSSSEYSCRAGGPSPGGHDRPGARPSR